ncbi:MAG: 5-nucleotidase/2 3-cyclic phosphodiesterase-like esterase [Planctomycetaceae bacterium]|nr:5-nucleotidase/2 3-cyclic phosphodiesterase-like esterase [Planctomycetaceae bacterium]
MNRLSVPLKGLFLPSCFAAVFALIGCFSSTPPSISSESGPATGAKPSLAIDKDNHKDTDQNSEPENSNANSDSRPTEAVTPRAGTTPTDEPVRQVALAANEKSPKKEPAEYVDRAPQPMLQKWTKPAMAIVLSGDIRGYLEPCGCSSRQSGGFARRADLFEQLRAKGWAVTGFDLGGSLKRSREHDQIKFTKILTGLRQMKYTALGLGPAELRLGAERLMSWHEPDGDTPGKGLAFVSANIVFFDNPEQGTPLPYRVVEINGVKIGVTSVLGDYYRDQFIPKDNNQPGQPITVKPPIPALQAAVAKIKAEKPDLMVLLSYGKVEESREFAKQVPDFDVVLTAGGPEEPDRTEQLGKSMLVQVGGKGKHVAVLGYYPEATPKIKSEMIDLDKFRFKNNPDMVQLMQDFQDELKDADLAVSEKSVSHASGANYL